MKIDFVYSAPPRWPKTYIGDDDILHYGESETQDRSATATNFKDKTSKTRINYRLDRVIKWQSRIARKEAMYARFIHTPEQIDVILGAGAGALWGQVMPPNASATNPLAVDFRQWYLETDYSIEATSMRRHDVEAKIDGMQELMTRTAPEQLKSPDPTEKALAYDAAAEYYELIGASDEIVQKYQKFAEYLRQQAQLMMQAQQQQAQMGQQQMADQKAQQDAAVQQQQAAADQQAQAATAQHQTAQQMQQQLQQNAIKQDQVIAKLVQQQQQLVQLLKEEEQKSAEEHALLMQQLEQVATAKPRGKRVYKPKRGKTGLIESVEADDVLDETGLPTV